MVNSMLMCAAAGVAGLSYHDVATMPPEPCISGCLHLYHFLHRKRMVRRRPQHAVRSFRALLRSYSGPVACAQLPCAIANPSLH